MRHGNPSSTSLSAYAEAEEPLIQRKARWQSHWVNGSGFTISMATAAVLTSAHTHTHMTHRHCSTLSTLRRACANRLTKCGVRQVLMVALVLLGASMLVAGSVCKVQGEMDG